MHRASVWALNNYRLFVNSLNFYIDDHNSRKWTLLTNVIIRNVRLKSPDPTWHPMFLRTTMNHSYDFENFGSTFIYIYYNILTQNLIRMAILKWKLKHKEELFPGRK